MNNAAMTGPIIPADQWPEGAVALVWSAVGLGKWVTTDSSTGTWEVGRADVPMPAGWDWRVPVMRQQSPAIDLEQFRKAVMRFRAMAELGVDVESMPMHFMKSQEKYAADVVEADRLLALIDGSKNNNLPHVGDTNVVVSQPTKGEEE